MENTGTETVEMLFEEHWTARTARISIFGESKKPPSPFWNSVESMGRNVQEPLRWLGSMHVGMRFGHKERRDLEISRHEHGFRRELLARIYLTRSGRRLFKLKRQSCCLVAPDSDSKTNWGSSYIVSEEKMSGELKNRKPIL